MAKVPTESLFHFSNTTKPTFSATKDLPSSRRENCCFFRRRSRNINWGSCLNRTARYKEVTRIYSALSTAIKRRFLRSKCNHQRKANLRNMCGILPKGTTPNSSDRFLLSSITSHRQLYAKMPLFVGSRQSHKSRWYLAVRRVCMRITCHR